MSSPPRETRPVSPSQPLALPSSDSASKAELGEKVPLDKLGPVVHLFCPTPPQPPSWQRWSMDVSPTFPIAFHAAESERENKRFIETPEIRLHWFYEMIDHEMLSQSSMPESDRVRAAMFEQMVQQHTNTSPAMLYAPMASTNHFRVPSHSRLRPRSVSRSHDEEQLGATLSEFPSVKRPKLDADFQSSSAEPRTLRFGPDHRLVSYAASKAPKRAQYTHPS